MSAPGVFLCHSSTDKPVVRQLYGRLLADGFRPWLDAEDLIPGQDWAYEIRKAITASDVVVVCLSKEAVGKTGYVQKEIRLALDAADMRPDGSIFVIPARLEPCELPERLHRWHWVDLYEDDGYRKLRRAIESVRPSQGGAESHTRDAIEGVIPRFDGLYVTKGPTYSSYLRFFPSGKACSVSSTGRAHDVARWLFPDSNQIGEADYAVSGTRISIYEKNPSGVVEYNGTISVDSMELELHSQSYINGNESFQIWRFERIDQ